MYVNADFFDRTGISKPTFLLMVGLSALGHIILFGIILFFPELHYKIPKHTVIDVDLVSLPAITPEPVQKPVLKEMPVKEPEIEELEETIPELKNVDPEPEPEPEPEEMVVPLKPPEKIELKPKKKIEEPEPVKQPEVKIKKKESLKKKSLKSKKLAIDSRTRSDSVKDAIDRFKRRERISNAGRIKNYGKDVRGTDLMKIYQAEIQAKIQRNWAFSDQMVFGRTDLKATIVLEILKSGYIKDYWFETRSGNKYFDESVIKAIKKSNPLPPFPEGYFKQMENFGFYFSPSDLKRGYIH